MTTPAADLPHPPTDEAAETWAYLNARSKVKTAAFERHVVRAILAERARLTAALQEVADTREAVAEALDHIIDVAVFAAEGNEYRASHETALDRVASLRALASGDQPTSPEVCKLCGGTRRVEARSHHTGTVPCPDCTSLPAEPVGEPEPESAICDAAHPEGYEMTCERVPGHPPDHHEHYGSGHCWPVAPGPAPERARLMCEQCGHPLPCPAHGPAPSDVPAPGLFEGASGCHGFPPEPLPSPGSDVPADPPAAVEHRTKVDVDEARSRRTHTLWEYRCSCGSHSGGWTSERYADDAATRHAADPVAEGEPERCGACGRLGGFCICDDERAEQVSAALEANPEWQRQMAESAATDWDNEPAVPMDSGTVDLHVTTADGRDLIIEVNRQPTPPPPRREGDSATDRLSDGLVAMYADETNDRDAERSLAREVQDLRAREAKVAAAVAFLEDTAASHRDGIETGRIGSNATQMANIAYGLEMAVKNLRPLLAPAAAPSGEPADREGDEPQVDALLTNDRVRALAHQYQGGWQGFVDDCQEKIPEGQSIFGLCRRRRSHPIHDEAPPVPEVCGECGLRFTEENDRCPILHGFEPEAEWVPTMSEHGSYYCAEHDMHIAPTDSPTADEAVALHRQSCHPLAAPPIPSGDGEPDSE